jgi:hypothetical protein
MSSRLLPHTPTVVKGIVLLEEIGHHLPFIQIKVEDIEADDIIAELCEFIGGLSIMSADKDLWQLTHHEGVEIIDHECNHTEPDYTPAQHVAYKALVGDTSDNIKGVLGVGPKTANSLLAAHCSLRRIMKWSKLGYKLGRMTYEEALPIVKRNLRLMRLDGSLLTDWQRRLIRAQYQAGLNVRVVDRQGLNTTVKRTNAGLPSSLTRLGIPSVFNRSILDAFKRLEQ